MQQHGNNIFARRYPDSGDGINRSKLNFAEHAHDAYQFNGIHKMHQHGSDYLVRRPISPTPTLGMGSLGQNSLISEHGHV